MSSSDVIDLKPHDTFRAHDGTVLNGLAPASVVTPRRRRLQPHRCRQGLAPRLLRGGGRPQMIMNPAPPVRAAFPEATAQPQSDPSEE